MFLEPHIKAEKKGWIEVICGSMFSGKTEELIRRLKRAKIANKSLRIIKPAVDTRYHDTDIISHDENCIESIAVKYSTDILKYAEGYDVVAIDEAQFFDDELPEVCNRLALSGTRVIIAGLDMDFSGKPFGVMPHLLSIAEYVTKLHAICMVCGNIALNSFRKVEIDTQVMLGEKDLYEARCRACFEKGEAEKSGRQAVQVAVARGSSGQAN